MGRLRLGLLTALALALAAPAGAAEITKVATTEPGDPFDLHVTLRWDRTQERARITREVAVPGGDFGTTLDDLTILRYTRVTNLLVPRIAVALYQDLELHVEVPYVLGNESSWSYGERGGVPVNDTTPGSPGANTIDASGNACTGPCPLFPVGQTVLLGGKFGDIKAGVAWGVFSDKRDDTKPFWLVGFDITLPSSPRYDPVQDRINRADWSSPYSVPGKSGPFGEKVWRWDLYTALSRRMGPADPYFKAHITAVTASAQTYSNCDHAAELAARGEMIDVAPANCGDSYWKGKTGAQLPWVGGLTFGTELVPFEDTKEDQKVTIDVRVFGDYTSQARFYNELTDANGKLNFTEGYLTAGGQVGLYLRASKYVSLQAVASLATSTSHLLTGESLGKGKGSVPAYTTDPSTGKVIWTDPTQVNPNYDWRYDAPGARFRISEVSLFQMSVSGVLHF